MLLLWDLYWPALAAALIIGVGTGAFAFRLGRPRARRLIILAVGIAATISVTSLWHGPFGTADTFRSGVESAARATLDQYEMGQVQARLERPLSRTLLLSGPADDFQRSELLRIMGEVAGVGDVRWSDGPRQGDLTIPMLAEAGFWSLVVFGLGLLLAYLVELRRRARAEWRW